QPARAHTAAVPATPNSISSGWAKMNIAVFGIYAPLIYCLWFYRCDFLCVGLMIQLHEFNRGLWLFLSITLTCVLWIQNDLAKRIRIELSNALRPQSGDGRVHTLDIVTQRGHIHPAAGGGQRIEP